MSDPLVRVEGLTKHFDTSRRLLDFQPRQVVQAVDGISFSIREGETFGLVGESGCGKSTTARLMLRLIEPTSGRIYFEGDEVTGLRPAQVRGLRKSMQIVFQDPYSSLNPRLRVREIVGEPLKAYGIARGAELERQVGRLLEEVGLSAAYALRYPHEFSGGQRQRIGIARALALRPKLVICDEPLSALDVSIQAQIIRLLYELQLKLHLTYLFITHDLRVVRLICSRVAVMYLGKMAEMCGAAEIFSEPLHPYTQVLFSAIPSIDPTAHRKRTPVRGDVPSASKPPPGCRFHPRCPSVMDVCRSVEPEWREIKPGHFCACHLHATPRQQPQARGGTEQA
jgi:oligopeptide/dipeptide ABC transporter ATP-binding protein